MTRPSDSDPSPSELLERARLALQSLQYRERAASYRAAAATLQAAMLHAENGNPRQLQEWLERESFPFESEFDSGHHASIGMSHHSNDTDQTLNTVRSCRVDAPHVVPPHREQGSDAEYASDSTPSPWERMEQAAAARLTARSLESAESAAKDESLEHIEPIEESLSGVEACVPQNLRVAIERFDPIVPSHPTRPWWKIPHVWVSLSVHAALVGCLGLIAISAANQPKPLSVVSATVEAENILMETPMEMVSELESMMEPLQPASMPTLSEMRSDVSINDISSLNGATTPTSAQHSVTSEVGNAVAESAQSAVGSKALAGAEFFGVKATGNTFVYIVDSSPSMRRDGAFEAARQEIVRSLSSMKPKQRYFVSFFGKELDPMVFANGRIEQFPIYAKPENLTKTIDWLGRVEVQKEGQAPNHALTEAIAMQPDGIFLLFDGDTKVDVAKHLRRVNRSDDILSGDLPKVPIHVVHFFRDEFQEPMQRVASENAGTYRFVPRTQRPAKGNR